MTREQFDAINAAHAAWIDKRRNAMKGLHWITIGASAALVAACIRSVMTAERIGPVPSVLLGVVTAAHAMHCWLAAAVDRRMLHWFEWLRTFGPPPPEVIEAMRKKLGS